MVVHAFNPPSWKVPKGHQKVKAGLNYRMKFWLNSYVAACVKKKREKKKGSWAYTPLLCSLWITTVQGPSLLLWNAHSGIQETEGVEHESSVLSHNVLTDLRSSEPGIFDSYFLHNVPAAKFSCEANEESYLLLLQKKLRDYSCVLEVASS